MTNWLQHVERWSGCQRCALGQQRDLICLARSEFVPGQVAPNLHLPCDVLFVGEAPGMNEDAGGLPFVGPAGNLLDQIIERSIPQGATYAMTNLVACFPRHAKVRGDNEPEPAEVFACRERLVEFINMAQPRLIVRVGSMVEQYLNFNRSVHMVDIVHPAFILARLPAAQKSMAVNKCVVQVHRACGVLQSPRIEWKKWELKDAESKESLRSIYGLHQSDVPF